MIAPVARAHAKLSPSAAKRWMSCPGSVRLSEGIPDKSSVYADEGTAAHRLAEMCIAGAHNADRFSGKFIDITAKKNAVVERKTHDRCFEVTDEMVDAVQQYLDFVYGLMAQGLDVQIEQRLDLTHLWPEQFGTGDCIAWDDKFGHLHVADFKYGRGVVVDPRDNPQGLSYASGAAKRYHNQGLKGITIHIIQPRAQGGWIESWNTTPERLAEFEAEFKKAAAETTKPDAALNPGEHCRFCPAVVVCEARKEASFAIARAEFGADGGIMLADVPGLTPEETGKILSQIDELETWCRRVREYAHDQALHGKMPHGFKLVANRANRKWKDEARAKAMLPVLFGLSNEEILSEPKLLSPAKIEAMIPGKNKAARAAQIDRLVVKESTGTVLAPENDKRPAVKADAASEFSDGG